MFLPTASLALGLGVSWLELRHRLRPSSPLQLRGKEWTVEAEGGRLQVTGIWSHNPHPRMEIFVPELTVTPVLLGSTDLSELNVTTRVISDHPDEPSRRDGYWVAYIVKGRRTTQARVTITIDAQPNEDPRTLVDTLWVDVDWINYGPFGRLARRQGVLVPENPPTPLSWRRSGKGIAVLCFPSKPICWAPSMIRSM